VFARACLSFKPGIFILCVFLSACGRAPPLVHQESFVFGTRVEILIANTQEATAEKAAAAVLREFDRLHRAYHAWQASELTAVNEAIAAGKPAKVSPELRDLILEARHLSEQGEYRFDPGIGRLIQLWGFHSDEFEPRLPKAKALADWRERPASIAQLRLENGVVTSDNPALALDFGGYLKGVALDRAAALLKAEGVQNALINIGGNVMALGDKYGKPWTVGIQHPRQPGPLAILELRDGEAIGTSGDYQRYFEWEGRRYSHLIDPATAAPAEHTQAVTVLISPGPKAGTRSDALSKPIFIAGPKHWRESAQKVGVTQVLRIDANGAIYVTPALKARLSFMGHPVVIETP
jgi:thiamine biosynthesis lipoprotein